MSTTLAKSTYRYEYGPFVGCPLDADCYARDLVDMFATLSAAGSLRHFYYWARDYETSEQKGTLPDQYLIQKTTNPEVNPVFILFKGTIGSPVAPPPEGWMDIRVWLDTHGFPYVALLGESDFQEIDKPPKDKVPMTGTLFELFSLLQSADTETTLRIFQIGGVRSDTTSTESVTQQAWLDRILQDLRVHRSGLVSFVSDQQELLHDAKEILYQYLGLGSLNPCEDSPPGLDALGYGSSLPAREKTIRSLDQRLRCNHEALTRLLGASGVGKSSLLRAGLLSEWFPSNCRPRHPGLNAIVVEPLRLIDSAGDARIDRDTDPLPGLAQALRAPKSNAPERGSADGIVHLLPCPLASVPDPPPLTTNRDCDLASALEWWIIATSLVDGVLVFLVDQAEQIEAVARRAARAEAELSGETVPELYSLSDSWWRFTALIALLTRRADPAVVSATQISRANDYLSSHTVCVVLCLHREDAIDLWPLKNVDGSTESFLIEPLHSKHEIKSVITRTLGNYGLTAEDNLLNSMVIEAISLANEELYSVDPLGNRVDARPKQASVLPQLVTALGSVVERWADEFGRIGRWSTADRLLSLSAFGEVARIDGAIDRLGERAWASWARKFALALELDAAGLQGAQRLKSAQERSFGKLFQRLVDVSEGGARHQDLAYLRRESKVARENEELIKTLRSHRLLTSTDRQYLRLPHRSILDHWKRAISWISDITPRLELKAKIRREYGLRDEYPMLPWTSELHEQYLHLALNWIGSDEGNDAAVRHWLQDQLIGRIDMEMIDAEATTALPHTPFLIVLSGNESWSERLIEHILSHKPSVEICAELLLICADVGVIHHVKSIIKHMQSTQRRRWIDSVYPSDKAYPLLLAAGNGHDEVVQVLVNVGAYVDRHFPSEDMSPLILASYNGHPNVVRTLINAGADPEQCRLTTGHFPLITAADRGHLEVVRNLLTAGANADRTCEKDESFPLIQAAAEGYAEIVSALLDAGADPNRQVESSGATSLLLAVQNGHSNVVRTLVDVCSEDQIAPTEGNIPVLIAALAGDAESVRYLIQAGVCVNQVQETDGDFPLLLAAHNGDAPLIRVLLELGAIVEQANHIQGRFPLEAAAASGDIESINALLNFGSKVNQVNKVEGTFAMLRASARGHSQAVRTLIHAGADVNQLVVNDQVSSLMLAVQDKRNTAIVQQLLDAGAEVNHADAIQGAFPLLIAVERGFDEFVEILLNAGANPNQINVVKGSRPLIMASQEGRTQIVQTLLLAGADVDGTDTKIGSFPLLMAAQAGHEEVIQLLVDAGASVDRTSEKSGMFPLLVAADSGYQAATSILLRAGADVNKQAPNGLFPLLQAAQKGHTEIVHILLNAGAQVNKIDPEQGEFPLLLASTNGHFETVRVLLEAGANVASNQSMCSYPLLSAAHSCYTNVVRLLINAGADPRQSDPESGMFPLLAAASQGHGEVVECLLLSGVDVDQKHKENGSFALLVAAASGCAATVRLLLQAGACVHDSDNYGIAPLEVAKLNDNDDIARMLIDAGAKPSPNSDIQSAVEAAQMMGYSQDSVDSNNRQSEIEFLMVSGSWVDVPPDDRMQDKVQTLIVGTGIAMDDFKGIHSVDRLDEPKLHDRLLLYRIRFVFEAECQNFAAELYWLDALGTDLAPVPLYSGLSFDALLRDYRMNGISPNIRQSAGSARLLASLILLTATPPKIPLYEDMPLPLSSTETSPRFYISESSSWRKWLPSNTKDGCSVLLPWFEEGSRLVVGEVTVTNDGVEEATIVESDSPCEPHPWELPSPVWTKPEHTGLWLLGIVN